VNRRGAGRLAALVLVLHAAAVEAQPGATVPAAHVAILQVEQRRAAAGDDLARLRTAARSADPQAARLALRALGRLERPAAIDTLLPALRHRLPEIRAEAAHGIAQAAGGWRAGLLAPGATSPGTVLAALAARLEVEDDAGVRAALCGAIGRLPYRSPEQVGQAEDVLVGAGQRYAGIEDRLGVARGLEALARTNGSVRAPGSRAIDFLRTLSGMPDGEPPRADADLLRDARVRRLALEALVTARAAEPDVVDRAARDPDPQVRRLAQRAAWAAGLETRALAEGLDDPSPLVRIEALQRLRGRGEEAACQSMAAAVADADPHVALVALDLLAVCGRFPEAVALLQRMTELLPAEDDRDWHRAAHAIVSLAVADPDRAAAGLDRFVQSEIWQVRMYAARAAARLGARRPLEQLAYDVNDNVAEAAIDALADLAGHEATLVYLTGLSRSGPQVVRAAARALAGAPQAEALVPALEAALGRMIEEGDDTTAGVRQALAETLTGLGAPPSSAAAPAAAPPSVLDRAELSRMAASRARITVSGAGMFDLALFTSEAPATVLRFVQLAEAGYYDGLTFHRVVPNFVIQGGSPGANEYVGTGPHMRDEISAWPHVRGAVGLSTRGRDTGDAQFFINLVDNPRLDHEYTVFGQILSGTEVVDRILEGDAIERVEILP
jgi:cyclophilin family peptidyl-prolyl cis-trans isomerase/HEAT repeat protein